MLCLVFVVELLGLDFDLVLFVWVGEDVGEFDGDDVVDDGLVEEEVDYYDDWQVFFFGDCCEDCWYYVCCEDCVVQNVEEDEGVKGNWFGEEYGVLVFLRSSGCCVC